MLIYIPMIFLSLFFTWLARHVKYKQRRLVYICAFIIPVIVAALRYNNGRDYLMYLGMMEAYEVHGSTVNSFESVKTVEVGFFLLLKLCGILWGNKYFLSFGLIALIICGFTYAGIWKQSSNVILSVYLFFAIGIYFDSFNGLRQFLALSIIFYATKYVYSGQFKNYCIMVMVAILFHYSAVIMIPVYFIRKANVGLKKACTVAIICLIGSKLIFELVTYMLQFTRYRYFLTSIEYKAIPTAASILYTTIVSIITYGYIQIGKQKISTKLQIMLNYQILVWCSTLISLTVPLASRLQEYFLIFEIVYIPCFLSEIESQKIRLYMGMTFVLIYTTINLYGIINNGWYTCLPYNFYFNYI